jgi:hypothetical protein
VTALIEDWDHDAERVLTARRTPPLRS